MQHLEATLLYVIYVRGEKVGEAESYDDWLARMEADPVITPFSEGGEMGNYGISGGPVANMGLGSASTMPGTQGMAVGMRPPQPPLNVRMRQLLEHLCALEARVNGVLLVLDGGGGLHGSRLNAVEPAPPTAVLELLSLVERRSQMIDDAVSELRNMVGVD